MVLRNLRNKTQVYFKYGKNLLRLENERKKPLAPNVETEADMYWFKMVGSYFFIGFSYCVIL